MKHIFYTNIRVSGNNILFLGYDNKTGKRIKEKIPYKPKLFIDSNEETGFKNIDNHNIKEIRFNSLSDCKDYVKRYSSISSYNIYGTTDFPSSYISEKYKGIEVPYSASLIRTFYLDIETFSSIGFPKATNPLDKITVITIFDSKTKKYYVFGEKNSPGGQLKLEKLKEQGYPIEWFEYSSEVELLRGFLSFWQENYPDVVTGWYSRGFDIPFIIERLDFILGQGTSRKLSPWNILNKRTANVKRFNKYTEETSYDIYGINELDYLDLYKKYTSSKQESYKLNYIASVELGETKLSFEGSLNDLYATDYHTYVDYNIQDVGLIVRLEEKLKFLELIIDVAYSGKSPTYNTALGTIKYWEILIYSHLEEQSIFSKVSSFGSSGSDTQYEGAFVKDPTLGKHKWVCNFDFTSLYPSIIRQVNIGPETLIKDIFSLPNDVQELLLSITPEKLIDKTIDTSILKNYGLSLAGNGKLYHTDRISFLAELMKKFFDKRIDYKNLMKKAKTECNKELEKIFHIKQLATKILLNSAYGACGNSHFQFFSVANAEAITITGKVAIQTVEKEINRYLNTLLKNQVEKNYVIYCDTDSVVGDTIIEVNGKKQTISEYYESNKEFIHYDEFNSNFVKKIDNVDYTNSMNMETGNIESKKIKYVMKHKVKKRMFKITIEEKEVIITEDHSIIVKRRGKFKELKPADLRKDDEIIYID